MATVITRVGKSVFANRVKGTGTEPAVVAWGTNPVPITAAATDVALFAEPAGDARVSGTTTLVTTTFTNDTFQSVGTQVAAAAREIREAALTDSTTKPFSAEVLVGSKVIGSPTETELKLTASYTPANGTFIQVRGEVMKVTAGTGTTTLTVERAQNGSAASSAIATNDAVTQGNIPGPYSKETTAPLTGGTITAHTDFAVVNLNKEDSIQWTWKVQFS